MKGAGVEPDEVKVTDIAMTLLEAIENGERRITIPAVDGAPRS